MVKGACRFFMWQKNSIAVKNKLQTHGEQQMFLPGFLVDTKQPLMRLDVSLLVFLSASLFLIRA
jgi:hypothetical protein